MEVEGKGKKFHLLFLLKRKGGKGRKREELQNYSLQGEEKRRIRVS